MLKKNKVKVQNTETNRLTQDEWKNHFNNTYRYKVSEEINIPYTDNQIIEIKEENC